MPSTWWQQPLIFVLLLGVPPLGAAVALALLRLTKRRWVLSVAGLALVLVVLGVIAAMRWAPSSDWWEQVLNPPQPVRAVLQVAPTQPWVQPPRTLRLPTVSPTASPTPTIVQTVAPTAHPYSLATIAVRNGTGETGLASRTSKRLEAAGFRILALEDDPQQGNRPYTLILDRGDHPEVRRALAALLHVPAEHVVINSEEPSTSGADIVLILGSDFDELVSATPLPTATLVGGPTATPNPYAGVTVVVRNGTIGRPGLAGRISDRLRARGFTVLPEEDDDKAGLRPHTLILDRGDHALVRQALADYLKVSATYIQVHASTPSAYGADIIIILGDDFEE